MVNIFFLHFLWVKKFLNQPKAVLNIVIFQKQNEKELIYYIIINLHKINEWID